jgi:hypothetical protein
MVQRKYTNELIVEKAKQFICRRIKRIMAFFVPSITKYENIQEKGFF